MNGKILVVDPNKDTGNLLDNYFAKKYNFIFSHDIEDAVLKIQTVKDIDLIITEISISNKDVVSLVKLFKENITFQRLIVMSFYGDFKNIRIAINEGANDFILKPFNFEDIAIVIKTSLEKSETSKTNLDTNDKFFNISQELSITGELQKGILPENKLITQNLEIYASNIPANDVGGDFYDFFQIDNDKIGVVIADVSGKNISAAIFMTMAKVLIKSFAKIFPHPVDCIKKVNNELCQDNNANMFVTCVYGIIDTKRGIFEFINCGHLQPIFLKNNDYPLMVKTDENIALGIKNDHKFTLQKINIDKGSCIILYTDGVVEAINDKNEEYDYKRFIKLLSSFVNVSSEEIASAINNDVMKFAKNTKQFDDITILVVKIR